MITKAKLRELSLHNGWMITQAGAGKVFICYQPAASDSGMAWQVVMPVAKTDPGGPWYQDGHRTFAIRGRGERAARLLVALTWATNAYFVPGQEWERSPYGDYHPKGTIARAIREKREDARS